MMITRSKRPDQRTAFQNNIIMYFETSGILCGFGIPRRKTERNPREISIQTQPRSHSPQFKIKTPVNSLGTEKVLFLARHQRINIIQPSLFLILHRSGIAPWGMHFLRSALAVRRDSGNAMMIYRNLSMISTRLTVVPCLLLFIFKQR